MPFYDPQRRPNFWSYRVLCIEYQGALKHAAIDRSIVPIAGSYRRILDPPTSRLHLNQHHLNSQ